MCISVKAFVFYIVSCQSGGAGIYGDGKSDPASWVFRPAGPNGNYQVAGVKGIRFHELDLVFDPPTLAQE